MKRTISIALNVCLVATLLLSIAAVGSGSDDNKPGTSEATVLIGDPHPVLFPDLKVDGYDVLEASIKVEDKGAKVSWAPFLFSENYSVWSETRFQLSQKDNLTTLGLSIKYNPLSPRSTTGISKWEKAEEEVKCGLPFDPGGLSNAARVAEKKLENFQKREEMFPYTNPDKCKAVAGNLDTVLKMLRSELDPETMIGSDFEKRLGCALFLLPDHLEQLKAVLSEKDGAEKEYVENEITKKTKLLAALREKAQALLIERRITFGLGVDAEVRAPRSSSHEQELLGRIDGLEAELQLVQGTGSIDERLERIKRAIKAMPKPTTTEEGLEQLQLEMEFQLILLRFERLLIDTMLEEHTRSVERRVDLQEIPLRTSEIGDLKAVNQKMAEEFAVSSRTRFLEELYKVRKPVLGLSYSVTFFPVLGGSDQDNDDDGLNDNEHRLKLRSLAGTMDLRFGQRWSLSALAAYSWERATAEEDAPLGEYRGFGLTVGHTALELDKDYQKTKAFKESMFIPSIVVGLALEVRECSTESETCADGVLRTQALTPFVDFKIKKTAQFRLGVPLQRKRLIEGDDQEEIGVVSLVGFRVGPPG